MTFWANLRDDNDLQSAIQKSAEDDIFVLILKHSTRCAISSMAKNRLERKANSNISYFLIDVIANRALSNQLSMESGIQHESPQAFLYSNGKLIDVKSHSAIDPLEIARQVEATM